MNFIAFDFETATSERSSPCELGLAVVKNSKVEIVQSWLIKPKQFPYFDNFNVSIHSITPEMVSDKPEFPEIWKEVGKYFNKNLVIAHSASFDISVLRKTLDLYKIPHPELEYLCSYRIAKRFWTTSQYDLKSLCKTFNIKLDHHRAASDAEACALLALKLFSEAGISNKEDISDKLQFQLGKISRDTYKSFSQTQNFKTIKGDPDKFDSNNIFFNKKVVFTGVLSRFTRSEAQQLVADIGGINAKDIAKDTDFLVIGQQDYRVVGQDGLSNKHEKAMKLIEKGFKIEIMSESEFMKNII